MTKGTSPRAVRLQEGHLAHLSQEGSVREAHCTQPTSRLKLGVVQTPCKRSQNLALGGARSHPLLQAKHKQGLKAQMCIGADGHLADRPRALVPSHLRADSLPQADPVDRDQGPRWAGALEHHLQ